MERPGILSRNSACDFLPARRAYDCGRVPSRLHPETTMPPKQDEQAPGRKRERSHRYPGRGLAESLELARFLEERGLDGFPAGEIARALGRDRPGPRERAVRFALFDGEEAPAGFSDFYAQGVRGSRAYVAAHRRTTAELVLLGKAWHRDFLKDRPGPVDRVVVLPEYGGVGSPAGAGRIRRRG